MKELTVRKLEEYLFIIQDYTDKVTIANKQQQQKHVVNVGSNLSHSISAEQTSISFAGFLPKTHITFHLFSKVMQERRQSGSRGGPLTPNDLA